jgi:hypothetical protein
MSPVETTTWSANWAWALPLIVLTVVIHVCGLAIINGQVVRALSGSAELRDFMPRFAVAMSFAALIATLLLGVEAATWAAAYRLLGALPDNKLAMLYSLSALTSYGHENLFLKAHWELLGALEALNGMMLFGLTTAFLFSMIQMVWPLGSQRWHKQNR